MIQDMAPKEPTAEFASQRPLASMPEVIGLGSVTPAPASSQAMRQHNPYVLRIGAVHRVVKLIGDVRPANL